MKKLPVFEISSPKIKEWVEVDEETYKQFHKFRWMRDRKGRVFRYVDKNKGPKKYLGHQILGKSSPSQYNVIHKDGDTSNYHPDNLLAEKREDK